MFSVLGLCVFIVPNFAIIPVPVPSVISEPLNNVIFSNKCIEGLGCFFTGSPFYHVVHRPISLQPFDLEDMNTKFWLFTSENTTERQLLEPNLESLRLSTFHPELDTKVIIHGFLSSVEEGDDLYRMKDALLRHGNYNVIIVDWTDSNGFPYTQAVSNTRVVGAQLAHLIKFLQNNTGIQPQSVHLIGHSLGSHIAGYAGERIQNLGRITGLDPAGPFFQHMDLPVRLDTSDATFIDVIHTDSGTNVVAGLGMRDVIGAIDFYPNGGHGQPGCEPTFVNVTIAGVGITAIGSSEVFTERFLSSCDHGRAKELFTASINDCIFLAVPCEDYEKFEKGECDNEQAIEMGFRARPKPQRATSHIYFLKTNDKYPFCITRENNTNSAGRNNTTSTRNDNDTSTRNNNDALARNNNTTSAGNNNTTSGGNNKTTLAGNNTDTSAEGDNSESATRQLLPWG